jgi:hypothetical protein
MTWPNFLIIGANRAGTTSLYQYLKQHPSIYMSPEKEPMFFSEYSAPFDRNRPDRLTLNASVSTVADYEALFKDVTTQTAIGEASTAYLPNPFAPPTINRFIPNAKLIAILRDPVERAFSAYGQYIRLGLEPLTDFARAVDEELAGSNWRHYVRLGLYYEQAKRYLDLFDSHQIKIHLYDDYESRPHDVVRDLFKFLDVDDSFSPDMSVRHNPSPLAASPAQPTASGTTLGTSAQVRERLKLFYREDILKLQDLIQMDLSKWLAPVVCASVALTLVKIAA